MNTLIDAKKYIQDHIHGDCVLRTIVEPCLMCLGDIVMSGIDYVVFALADKWINPGEMLEMPDVRRHIKSYLGSVLERSRYSNLRMIRDGKA
jgi:tRNA(Arg) A34 adenosine deaminase TadA